MKIDFKKDTKVIWEKRAEFSSQWAATAEYPHRKALTLHSPYTIFKQLNLEGIIDISIRFKTTQVPN